ncbi:DUF7541 family protein [Halobacterium noricense]|uniref:DUF7541 family protein n=1 Tax=Halobacterium noricense TaxID=223182 RepID=UPI001E313E06|nr:hypothetical protein [Halobacterium noricense]UHH25955.1 hypothetical protein LT974_03220 [Halobacterium noricense]
MVEQTEQGLSDQYPRASPWPIPLVLGLVISEIGILFDGLLPVAVGGLVLLAGSVVGILRESGFASTLHRPALAVAAVFGGLGGLLYVATSATARGLALGGTGIVVAAASVALFLLETGRL